MFEGRIVNFYLYVDYVKNQHILQALQKIKNLEIKKCIKLINLKITVYAYINKNILTSMY